MGVEYRPEPDVTTVSVAVAEPPPASVTEVGLMDTWGPEGETLAVRLGVPENPFKLFRVIVVVLVSPGDSVSVVGFDAMPMSGEEGGAVF